jgi:dolichol-phosphate mannosyltransferase
MRSTSTLLLIPALNEADAIGRLIKEAFPLFPDILVVDGHSIDRTKEIAAESGARVVEQRFGKGKGCAVRTGFEEFLVGTAQCLAIVDGDGTNNPSDLVQLVDSIHGGEFDVALGSRTRGTREPGSMDWLTLASNRIVSFMLGARFLTYFTDVQTGYWALSRGSVEKLLPQLKATGFEVELEIFTKAMHSSLRVVEVPVSYRRRTGKSKFSFWLRMRSLMYALYYLFLV